LGLAFFQPASIVPEEYKEVMKKPYGFDVGKHSDAEGREGENGILKTDRKATRKRPREAPSESPLSSHLGSAPDLLREQSKTIKH
jgi:hypothetical protein